VTDLMENTLKSLKGILEANTVFGDPIRTESGATVIPVSKVIVGFVVGGGEYADLSSRRVGNHYPMAGGSGGGLTLVPVGFIVDTAVEIRFIPIEKPDQYEKIIKNINKFIKIVMKMKEKGHEE